MTKNTDYEKFEEMINAYVKVNEVSPIKDVTVKDEETGEVTLDIDSSFEKKLIEEFGEEEVTKLFSEYINNLIKEVLESLESLENEDTEE